MKMTKEEQNHFVEWVFPKLFDSEFQYKKYKENKARWLLFRINRFRRLYTHYSKVVLKTEDLKSEDYKAIIQEIDKYFKECEKLPKGKSLDTAVLGWGQGKTKEDLYRKVMLTQLPKEPMVFFGPSRSKGHYLTSKNRIYIDPFKNDKNPKKIATLEFELVNASKQTKYDAILKGTGTAREKAWKKVEVEFGTSKREIQKLLRQHHAKDYGELVTNMGIGKQILQNYKPRAFDRSTIKKVRIPMPPKSTLADQDKRNALWWYQVGGWKDCQRVKEWAYRPHTPGKNEATIDQFEQEYSRTIRKYN